jgi:hypothetical protein
VESFLPNGFGFGLQANDHAHDSAVDGVDGYGIFQWQFPRWRPGVFLGCGQNIEDERFRTSAGVRLDVAASDRVTLSLGVAAQREYGAWKGDREPMAAVITIGGGWRF